MQRAFLLKLGCKELFIDMFDYVSDDDNHDDDHDDDHDDNHGDGNCQV